MYILAHMHTDIPIQDFPMGQWISILNLGDTEMTGLGPQKLHTKCGKTLYQKSIVCIYIEFSYVVTWHSI